MTKDMKKNRLKRLRIAFLGEKSRVSKQFGMLIIFLSVL